MDRLAGLTIFFPAYNDAPALPALVEGAFRVGETCAEDLEVLVVNDASQDDTDAVLEELRRRFGARLRVIRHAVNAGYGGALRSGFRAAAKEFVFYTDGDGQYDLADLPQLVAQMAPGVGLVNGYKTARHDPWYRRLLGRLYQMLVRPLFGLRVRDVDCDFRLIRRCVLDALELRSNSGAICVELVLGIQSAGCGIAEVPVRHLPRRHGRSEFFRPFRLWQTAVEVGRLWVAWRLRGQGGRVSRCCVRGAEGC